MREYIRQLFVYTCQHFDRDNPTGAQQLIRHHNLAAHLTLFKQDEIIDRLHN